MATRQHRLATESDEYFRLAENEERQARRFQRLHNVATRTLVLSPTAIAFDRPGIALLAAGISLASMFGCAHLEDVARVTSEQYRELARQRLGRCIAESPSHRS